MTYNLTFMETSTNILQVANGISESTGSYFGGLILLLVAVICFIGMKRYDNRAAILGSAFITTIVAGYMVFIDWISMTLFVFPATIALIALFLSIIQLFSD